MVYEFIYQLEGEFPISVLRKTFEISRSAYYAFKKGQTYQPSAVQVEQLAQIKEVLQVHKRRYGARRLVSELQDMGLIIGRKRIRSLMREQGLVAIQPKSFIPRTTDLAHPELSAVHSRHRRRVTPNLLLEVPFPTSVPPSLFVWVSYL